MIKGLEQLCDSIRAGESTKALHQAEELEELARIEDEGVDFKAVVDNLLDGVYVTDGKAVTQYVNPAYTKHTGIQPEEIVGLLGWLSGLLPKWEKISALELAAAFSWENVRREDIRVDPKQLRRP